MPWFVDHLSVPVIAAGGIGDRRGVAAALTRERARCRSARRCFAAPKAGIAPEWAAALDETGPESTTMTRAYSGRLARALSTRYVRAWEEPSAPQPAPFPEQAALLARWRAGDAPGIEPASHFAGQSAALASPGPAGDLIARMWRDASAPPGMTTEES